jgi:hypothetical protein
MVMEFLNCTVYTFRGYRDGGEPRRIGAVQSRADAMLSFRSYRMDARIDSGTAAYAAPYRYAVFVNA